MVAFLPKMSRREGVISAIFSWSALINRRFTSVLSKGETDWTRAEEAASSWASASGRYTLATAILAALDASMSPTTG